MAINKTSTANGVIYCSSKHAKHRPFDQLSHGAQWLQHAGYACKLSSKSSDQRRMNVCACAHLICMWTAILFYDSVDVVRCKQLRYRYAEFRLNQPANVRKTDFVSAVALVLASNNCLQRNRQFSIAALLVGLNDWKLRHIQNSYYFFSKLLLMSRRSCFKKKPLDEYSLRGPSNQRYKIFISTKLSFKPTQHVPMHGYVS